MSGSGGRPLNEIVARWNVRDADAWLRLAAWLVVWFAAVQISAFSFGRDQGIFALVGEGLLHGKLPYRDLWDYKPPGIYFIYAAAQSLFGKNMLAVRLLEILGLLATMFAFGRLGQVFFGDRTAGYLGGAVAALIHVQLDFWHTAQPETFGGYLTVYALAIATHDFEKWRRTASWILVGFLFGVAFLLKPPLGGGALVCAAYLARKEWGVAKRLSAAVRPALAIGLSAAAVIAMCGGWFALRGGWPALWWTFREFTPGHTSLGWAQHDARGMFYQAVVEAFFRFSALSAAGVIAAVTMSPIHRREREGLFLLLGVIAMHIVGIAMQAKFFPYHYGATLPLIAFIAGLGLCKLWRRGRFVGISGTLAFAAFVVLMTGMRNASPDLPQGFWARTQARIAHVLNRPPYESREALDRDLYHVADYNLDADRVVAGVLRSRTGGEDPIFVWGFEPVIYWLAERTPSSRFIYNVPQRTHWERAYARGELMRDLGRRPPTIFVVQSNDYFSAVTGRPSDSRDDLRGFPELSSWLEQRYEKSLVIETFEIYERRK